MRQGTALLYALDRAALARAAENRRWPKWSTMCHLRLLGNPVLNAVCITPDADATARRTATAALAEATGARRLLVRSDGGVETGAYYRGGNSFPIHLAESHAAGLLAAGRAVILMEATNRFTNQLTALLRADRPSRGQPGTFTVEALGPGYDVGDLTRGGIRPQVTVSVSDVDWLHYDPPWWVDLDVARDLSCEVEAARRQARLTLLAPHVRAAGGQDSVPTQDQAAAVADWLRGRGYVDLWRDADPTIQVVRSVPGWFDVLFLIAATHPNRDWRCLATSLSNLGAGRTVYWDVVDGAHKYATLSAAKRRVT